MLATQPHTTTTHHKRRNNTSCMESGGGNGNGSGGAAGSGGGGNIVLVVPTPTATNDHKPDAITITDNNNMPTVVNAGGTTPLAKLMFSFWPLAIGITLIFLVHGWLAELVVLVVVKHELKLGWFFALLTVFGQWVPSVAKRGWEKTDGFRFEHFLVGVAHCLSLGLSNSGGLLVEYNTFSLFKSSKVVFVMLMSWLTLGVSASVDELFWGLGIMFGLVVLTGADEIYAHESERLTFPLIGGAMLLCGVCMSALVSVGQQAALQRRGIQPIRPGSWRLIWGAQHSRISTNGKEYSKDDEREALLFYSNLVSLALLCPFCYYIGELNDGMYFFRRVAGIDTWFAQLGALALVAVGQRLVLSMNGTYGATATAAVLTLRKVASFISSVMVYPKPFHIVHIAGLTIVVVSSIMIQRAEAIASNKKIRDGKKVEKSLSSSPRGGSNGNKHMDHGGNGDDVSMV